ncbi:hypothetical protein FPOAC2_02162 [Fusarium poae]
MGSCKKEGKTRFIGIWQTSRAKWMPITTYRTRATQTCQTGWMMGRGHASAQLLTLITRSTRSHSNLKASYPTLLIQQQQQQHHHFHHKTISNMPSYIVTCKEDATDEQVQSAKQHAIDQGGKIGHEYSLIKGFSVEFPQDSVQTLESHEHIHAVEADGEMKTQ